jgi:hypothetical protein
MASLSKCGLLLWLALTGCAKEAAPRPANLEFIWDFRAPKVLVYSYATTALSSHVSLSGTFEEEGVVRSNGTLKVSAKDGLANVELDMVTTGDDENDVIRQQVIEGMQENGDASTDDFQQEIMLPLPSTDLNEGERDEVTFTIETKVNGETRHLKVTNTLTHMGNTTIAGRDCALLQGVLSGRKVHNVPAGKMSFSMGGTGTYCFDVERHVYVSAETSYWLRMRATYAADSSLGIRLDLATASAMQLTAVEP